MAGLEHKDIFKPNLKTVIDIGANKGQFALASRKYAPNAKIFSFEPLENPSKIFSKIFLNDKNTYLYSVAIGPKPRNLFINLSAREDSSSILKIGHNQTKLFKGTDFIGKKKIRVAPLNFFSNKRKILRPSLLKIDVQGFEFEVLKGSLSLLKYFDFIYCECSYIELYEKQKLAPEIIVLLKSNGFSLVKIYNAIFDKNNKTIQADLFFMNSVPN